MRVQTKPCEKCGKPMADGKHPSMCNCSGKQRRAARKMRVSKTCLGCGEQFELHYCHRDRLYCSRQCMSNAKSVSVRCANCGQEFRIPRSRHDKAPTRRFFCSVQCAKTSVATPCAYCGKEIMAPPSRLKQSVSGQIFCSNECYASSMRTPVTREELDHWYNDRGETLEQIARRLGIDLVTVRDLMDHFGLSRRSRAIARIEYPRRAFSGSQAEKAYLIGFRLGDLNVRMDLPTSKTIQVRCGTTIPAQVELIRGLFEPYGHVNTRKGTIGETQVECHLDMSFDFLLPKEDRVPDWVAADDPCFWAFLAGYMDAESYIGIRKGKSVHSAIVEIASCDIGILRGLWSGLNERGVICPQLYLKGRAGTANRRGTRNNRDYYDLCIMRKASLDKLFSEIAPFLKHGDKQVSMARAWTNIRERGLP